MCSADGPLYIPRWLQNANLELKFCLCFLSVNKNARTNMIFPLHYNVFYNPPAAEEVKKLGVMYDVPTAPVRDNKSDPATTINNAYVIGASLSQPHTYLTAVQNPPDIIIIIY